MNLLTEKQIQALDALKTDSSRELQVWLSGYFYGLSDQTPHLNRQAPGLVESAVALPVVTIIVATQTGNAMQVGEWLKQALVDVGVKVELLEASALKVKNLTKITHLAVISSTHGEGEPPDSALAFHKALLADKAPALPSLNYAVFGLGDTSYELFCQTAKEFDQRLTSLGAQPLLPRVEADVEFESVAKQWVEDFSRQITQVASNGNTPSETLEQNHQAWSESRPFNAEVLAITPLTDIGSEKSVWHLELDIEGSGIGYQPGDIVAILVENQAELVKSVIQQAGLSANENVQLNEQTLSLEQALKTKRALRGLTPKQLEEYQKWVDQPSLLANTPQLDKAGLSQSDVLDLFNLASPAGLVTAQQLADWLLPLRSRQYSIASSQALVDDELHITVREVAYSLNGRERFGVCSHALAQLAEGDKVALYVKSNPNFKLPTDTNAPIMMVGPGTGVAPFRAFMQQRQAQGLSEKSWLFFGEQHFKTDFLYQTEWQKWVSSGVLEKISLAFSRDQADKVYVQDRLIESAKEVFEWLEDGAYFYVCGDQARMAKDVHAALLQIISQQGRMSAEQAEDYIQNLIQQKRYQRDVY